MDSQKVDMFMMVNGKFFESYQLHAIREQLLQADESKWAMVQSQAYKDPSTALLISIFAGTLGIDRFYIGDTGMGIGKLLTLGGCGIWHIVDFFLIMGATREKNMEAFQRAMY